MINEPPTTSNTPSSDLNNINKGSPRPLWLGVLRSIFLQWWLIPLIYLIIYIFIVAFNLYTHSDIYYALLLSYFITYWWIVIPALAIAITLLFRAYTWALIDKSREYFVQWKQPQREREQQPPPSGFKLQHTLRGHTREIIQIAWSPDGRQFASGSYDQTVRLWDGATGQALHTLTGHTSSVYSVAWSPDGRLLASGSDDQTVRLWDVTTGRQIRALEGYTDAIFGISFSADSRLLASKSWDGTVRLWKADTWEEVTSIGADFRKNGGKNDERGPL